MERLLNGGGKKEDITLTKCDVYDTMGQWNDIVFSSSDRKCALYVAQFSFHHRKIPKRKIKFYIYFSLEHFATGFIPGSFTFCSVFKFKQIPSASLCFSLCCEMGNLRTYRTPPSGCFRIYLPFYLLLSDIQ